LIVSLALVVACSGKNEEVKTPPPGLKQVPQILVGLDSSRADPWLKHEETIWGPSGNVRVERGNFGDLESAKETLRIWNGRSGDLLILGPGFPQKAWTDLKLPKRADLRVVFWEGESSGVYSLRLDRSALERLLGTFCRPGCELVRKDPDWHPKFKEGPLRVWFGEGSAPGLSLTIRIDWSSVAHKLLMSDPAKLVSGRQNIDIFGGEFEITIGESFPNPEAKDRADAELKNWSMQELRRGGSL